MPKKFEYSYPEEWYTVQGAETAYRTGTKSDIETMHREYTKMRDVAQKRLQRLENEFSWTKTYQNHKEGFAKLSDIDPRNFPKAFSDLAKFVKAKSSSASGQREIRRKTINTWQNQGIDLNLRNYNTVMDILETMRKRKMGKIYGSDKVVELADTMLEYDMSLTGDLLKNLGTLLEHSDEAEQVFENVSDSAEIDEVISLLGW